MQSIDSLRRTIAHGVAAAPDFPIVVHVDGGDVEAFLDLTEGMEADVMGDPAAPVDVIDFSHELAVLALHADAEHGVWLVLEDERERSAVLELLDRQRRLATPPTAGASCTECDCGR